MHKQAVITRLQRKYKEQVTPELMKKMGYTNQLQMPKILKVVINVGLGEGANEIKLLEDVQKELGQITGQHAVITKAKKAISNFKVRKGSPVGCKVTLRGRKMYEFLDRFINVAIPRIKDFKGVSSKSFDQRGNYTLGLTEQIIFPEIEYDKVSRVHGMDIVIVSSARNKREALELLKLMGLPFKS